MQKPTLSSLLWIFWITTSLSRLRCSRQARTSPLGGNPCSDNRVIRKETEDQTRKRVEEDLEDSATKYADHAENTILKLQQAYLKKYHPRQYAHSNDVSQHHEDAPNRRLSGRVSALFRGRQEDLQGLEPKSEEGIAHITHGFQLGLLNSLSLISVRR